MKDIKTFILESKKKLSNVSKDIFKNEILGIPENDKELNNAVDAWLDNHDKMKLGLYLDNEAEVYFKTEKLNYEYNKITTDEINDILDVIKNGSKSYSNDYIELIINDDIIYSKTLDGIVIIK